MANTYKRINVAGSGGGGSNPNFQLTFNNSTSWGSPVSGEYVITILPATHNKGSNPQVQLFELINPGEYEEVTPNTLQILSNGTVSIKILSTPDLRFAGKIIIG